jgi:outer membrane immunogenic protein
MIRRILMASAGALALSEAAFAADLPSQAPPPVFLPPPPLWTGFYVGINAGYEWSASKDVNIATIGAGNPFNVGLGALANGTVPVSKSNGFIGGGQIGYNYQFANSWVVGLEADLDGVAGGHGTGSVGSVGNFPPAIAVPVQTVLSATRTLDYLGTVRGRIGYLVTPTLLIYGDGGLAYGGVNTSGGITQFAPNGFVGANFAPSFHTAQVGWTAGGGVEWMFLPNWSAKVEYLYYDLGSVTQSSPLNALVPAGPVTGIYAVSQARTHFNGNVVRVGLNYHFNWGAPPVVAKY